MRTLARLIACALVLVASVAGAQSVDGAAALVGGRTLYDVKAGDTLGSIGARFGVADLFQRVEVGTTGVLIYQPVVVAVINGRVWIEAHPDEYRRVGDAMGSVQDAAERTGLQAVIDWALVDEVVRQRRGRAVDVTMSR